jgi:hypothetical protein
MSCSEGEKFREGGGRSAEREENPGILGDETDRLGEGNVEYGKK